MKRLTKFLISVFAGAMLLGMTAFASEYSVTPANAVFYTNSETVVLADASAEAQVILPECEAGLPIQVTGVTSNGYWQIVLGDATYYVVGAGLSQTAEMAISTPKATVQAKASKPTQSEMPTYTAYADVKAYAISLGYPIGTAVYNGDGTCTTYSIHHITPNNTVSFDGEYITMDADRTAARDQARAILGYNDYIHDVDFGNYRNVKIAKGENGYTWDVCREQFWLTADTDWKWRGAE